MIIIGCDYHPGFQQIAYVNTDTGDLSEERLGHKEQAEQFYQGLRTRGLTVRVGMEASGHARWFERLLNELQIELWIGDAAAVRTKRVRKQKTDRQDAQLLLRLLVENRFQLHVVALNEGLRRKKALWRPAGRAQLESLALAPWASRRRQDLLDLLDQFTPKILELTRRLEEVVEKRPVARRLQTHPGVGPLTALAFELVIGTPERFQCAKQIASYVGLVPSEESSGDRRRLGHISKQGNALLRFLLVEAAQVTVRSDPQWRSQFFHLAMRRGRKIAKVAMARKLAVELYWMWRRGWDDTEMQQLGSHAGEPRNRHGVL